MCKNHEAYNIVDGILSFTDQDHFDSHWEDNYYESIPEMKLNAPERFLQPILKDDASSNSLYLDAGCGDGVHLKVLNDVTPSREGNNVALDISTSALLTARKRDAKNWEFIHGDVGMLPFASDSFDASFSFGVLAYTPDPKKSFSELVRVTKPGGKIGIWIYPKSGGLGGWVFGMVRGLCKLTGSIGTSLISNMIVPVLGLLPTQSKLSLANASWKQCKEVVLVNIAPEQLFFPEPEEIEAWFKDFNLEITSNDKNNPIAIWGKK